MVVNLSLPGHVRDVSRLPNVAGALPSWTAGYVTFTTVAMPLVIIPWNRHQTW
jgi:hypothetical protein